MPRRLMAPAEEAVAEWLLTFASWDEAKASEEWATGGIALLRCGAAFCAIRVPVPFVEAAAMTKDPATVDAYLAEALHGAPAFRCNSGQSIYVLVEPTVIEWWKDPDAECIGAGRSSACRARI
ncbi:hypothetical protein CLM62_06485 [Streptomyces sp. SA15]|uniref:hypothetical protein n=1 Tax=Streptomyces sp. SA15 TaxID=934019 RepID=UPI000BAEBB8D|nr:hypothetical protein [Streptomyces sp. SA15]PAZ16593.1 hypothetical protein CLM62_06485 [Streptomyces sp. SA15]